MLVGDKGYVSAEEMKGDRDPHIAYHGSLSCMVSVVRSYNNGYRIMSLVQQATSVFAS